MARDYFLQTTSLVPPRGVRVEMTEIKPLRPNQATILPGVAVMGQGMKFEVKDRSKYRSRNGFAQNSGIAQFSASFNRKKSFWKPNSHLQNGQNSHQYRPTSYEPYRPQQPRTIGAFSDDECYLNSTFNGSGGYPGPPRGVPGYHPGGLVPSSVSGPPPGYHHTAPNSAGNYSNFAENIDLPYDHHNITNSRHVKTSPSNSPPRAKRPLVPIIKKNDKQFTWDRAPSPPKYQNLIFTTSSSEDEFAKPHKLSATSSLKRNNGSVSPKFAASHHALCTNQGLNKATSSQGVQHTYDFLFDRHLKVLTTMDQDEEELYNEDNLRTIEAINQPLETDATTPNGEEEDMESINESEELSIIGEDLVNQSLAEVTAILDQQMDLNNGSTSETEIRSASTKRISFLVPSDVPHISLSSADESQMSQ